MSAINSKNEKSVSTNETDTDINDRSDNSGKEKTDCDLNKYDEYSRFRDLLIKEANYDPYTANPSNCKRQDYIQWEDYFMAVAYLSSQRSKDPKTLYAIDGANTDCETNLATFKSTGGGACIVDSANRIVGIGYNGFPTGCSDDYLPWTNETQNDRVPFLHTKNPYMCHAEVNAILNKCSVDVKGAKLYVLQYPNNESAKIIIQSGIREIIYMQEPDPNNDIYVASKIMFAMAGVKTRRFQPLRKKIILDFGCSEEKTMENDITKDHLSISNSETPLCNESVLFDNHKNGNSERDSIKKLLQDEANYDIDNIPSYAKKGTSYLSWDDYFLAVSFLSAKRSKDPNTQVGACIVNRDNRIVGIGYNGFPRGCSDDFLPWARRDSKGSSSSLLQTKYPYVCHAEVNAILNKCSADVVGSTLYVALFPCNDCAKMIIQAGIREVVYLNDYYHDTDQCRASRVMFAMSGVKLRHHKPRKQMLLIPLA